MLYANILYYICTYIGSLKESGRETAALKQTYYIYIYIIPKAGGNNVSTVAYKYYTFLVRVVMGGKRIRWQRAKACL